jgi:hypothetical protein
MTVIAAMVTMGSRYIEAIPLPLVKTYQAKYLGPYNMAIVGNTMYILDQSSGKLYWVSPTDPPVLMLWMDLPEKIAAHERR